MAPVELKELVTKAKLAAPREQDDEDLGSDEGASQTVVGALRKRGYLSAESAEAYWFYALRDNATEVVAAVDDALAEASNESAA